MEKIRGIRKEEITDALSIACGQVEKSLPAFTEKFQNAYSENGFYRPIENVEWTTGFWTGEIWLAYEYTEKEKFRQAAEIQIDSFLKRIEEKIAVARHAGGEYKNPMSWWSTAIFSSIRFKKLSI